MAKKKQAKEKAKIQQIVELSGAERFVHALLVLLEEDEVFREALIDQIQEDFMEDYQEIQSSLTKIQ